jgi:hypothetical protein
VFDFIGSPIHPPLGALTLMVVMAGRCSSLSPRHLSLSLPSSINVAPWSSLSLPERPPSLTLSLSLPYSSFVVEPPSPEQPRPAHRRSSPSWTETGVPLDAEPITSLPGRTPRRVSPCTSENPRLKTTQNNSNLFWKSCLN